MRPFILVYPLDIRSHFIFSMYFNIKYVVAETIRKARAMTKKKHIFIAKRLLEKWLNNLKISFI
jgi:hypothetical protein